MRLGRAALVLGCACPFPTLLHAQDIAPASAPAVTLVRPAEGAAVPAGKGGTRIDLAWQPLAAAPVSYFVEVVVPGSGEPREVFTGYTNQAELHLRVDDAGRYAWRVLAVNRASAHYSVSPWWSFDVEAAR